MKKTVLLVIFFLFFTKPVLAATPANINANTTTKNIYNYLIDLPSQTSNRVLSGQFFDYQARYQHNFIDLYNQTGRYPAIMGSVYGHKWTQYGTEMTLDDMLALNRDYLIPHAKQGGIITIYGTIWNPWTGKAWDDLTGFTPSSQKLTEVITPGTAANQAYLAKLDKFAAAFDDLQKNNVTVLWRPFYEMTYPDTWWGRTAWGYPENLQPQVYINLWQHMFNYFTNVKHLNNLLWVFAAADTDPWLSSIQVYPGANYVDIVGVDVYKDAANLAGESTTYQKFLNLGKPFAFCESGPGTIVDGSWDARNIINSIKNNYPKTIYFQEWASWTDNYVALVDVQHTNELLSDSWVVTRDELPKWSSTSIDISSLRQLLSQFTNLFVYNELVRNFGN